MLGLVDSLAAEGEPEVGWDPVPVADGDPLVLAAWFEQPARATSAAEVATRTRGKRMP